jgi:DNA-binding transcriptional MocR family regulator
MWIEDGTADRTVERKRLEASVRQEIAREILHGCTYRSHPAAYNVWLELPEGWTSAEFALELRRRGVAVTQAGAFAVDKLNAPAAIRICLGAAEDRDQLRTALDIVVGMLRDGEHRTSGLV